MYLFLHSYFLPSVALSFLASTMGKAFQDPLDRKRQHWLRKHSATLTPLGPAPPLPLSTVLAGGPIISHSYCCCHSYTF